MIQMFFAGFPVNESLNLDPPDGSEPETEVPLPAGFNGICVWF